MFDFNIRLRVAYAGLLWYPCCVYGSLEKPQMQPVIQTHSCDIKPHNGIVYGFALYSRHGARLTYCQPVLRGNNEVWRLNNLKSGKIAIDQQSVLLSHPVACIAFLRWCLDPDLVLLLFYSIFGSRVSTSCKQSIVHRTLVFIFLLSIFSLVKLL
jgi:hypothetical protein